MGMRLLAWILATLALLVVIADAGAEELGTAAQAKAMIQQAIEAIKANEADAIQVFNDKNNKQFHLLDLYVSVSTQSPVSLQRSRRRCCWVPTPKA